VSECQAPSVNSIDPWSQVDFDDLHAVLHRELRRLPERYRLPLLLCSVEGLSRSEAARQLGWKEGTVGGRLARGRVLLHRRLSRRGFFSAGMPAMLPASEMGATRIPAALAKNTLRLAVARTAGTADLAGNATAVAQAILRTMWVTKLQGLSALLALCVGLAGAGWMAYHAWVALPAAGQQPPTASVESRRAGIADQPAAAKNHRVLILDSGGDRGGPHQRIILLEIESGKVLAEAATGSHTDIGLAPRGDVVSAVFNAEDRSDRLAFYRTSDLKQLSACRMPALNRVVYHNGVSNDTRFAPDGSELIVKTWDPQAGASADQLALWLRSLKKETDPGGICAFSRPALKVRRSWGLRILRVADWPRVHAWNPNLGLLEVLDFDKGEVVGRVELVDPALVGDQPAKLEEPANQLDRVLRLQGFVVSSGGRYAYYLPTKVAANGPGKFLKKIELTADSPRVVFKSTEPAAGFRENIAAISEAAGLIFALDDERQGINHITVPSHRVRVLNTKDLKTARTFELPLTDCRGLEISVDGKLLYALGTDHKGALTRLVVDAVTGKTIQVLKNVGTYPYVLVPLPE
jgi:hypothetical protein